MRFFLLLTLLSFSITLFGTTTTSQIDPQPASSAKSKEDAKSKLNDMDDDFESDFDAETDEEALQKLKKKAADKRKESDDKKKEEGKEDQIVNKDKEEKKEESKKEGGLQDSKVNNTDNSNYDDNSNDGYEQPKENKELEDEYAGNAGNSLRKAITLGGGYDGSVDYHPSNHFGIEGIMYHVPETGFWIHGISVGAGVVKLDDIAEPYISVAYSGLFMPMSVNWGPFLRVDLGFLGWENSSDDDDEGVTFEDEEDSSFAYGGVMVKAGGGFLIGGKTGSGLSVQLLYTMHMTTIGKNEGVELQVGFHF